MHIFENGIFISCEGENRIFSVLIEDGGRIVFTGESVPDAYKGISNRTDMKGQCVVPAFADTHMHFESFCFFQENFDVRSAETWDDLCEFIRGYERIHPEAKILLGFGCSAHTLREKQLPDTTFLDQVTRKPLLLVKYDGHAAVANSALLRKFPKNITGDPGFDKASGWLNQHAYYKAVNHITKSISPYKLFKTFIKGTDCIARNGIGLIHTVEGLGFPLDVDVDILRLAARGLPLHFRIYFQTMNIRKVVRRKLPRIGGCFTTALDGSFGSEDAALLEPYTNNPDNKGMLAYSQRQVSHFVKRANRIGLQVSMHAIGDAAVEQAITAYEEALEDFPRSDHRHVIIHANLISPFQLERAARLGVHIAAQPPLLHWEEEPMEYLVRILGDRAYNLIPLKSMLKSGLVIAGGSDAPCTPPDPILGIHSACNHPNPVERISILDALRMHTNWAARLSFDENERGTLTEDKVADFAVLDSNPLAVAPEKLKEMKVIALYLNGKPYKNVVRKPFDLCLNALKNKILSP
jgi:predicted amidohydrolase YtcJ